MSDMRALNDAVKKMAEVLEDIAVNDDPCDDLRRDRFEKVMCAGMALNMKLMTHLVAAIQKQENNIIVPK